MRKNLNIPDETMRRIETIRYKERHPTDTKVIMILIDEALAARAEVKQK